MGASPLSHEAFKRVHEETKKAGSATHAGEQRHRAGKGLHELVDPKGYGVIRRSIGWLEPLENGLFILKRGPAMLIEDRLDTTGSMGNNVEIAMEYLPHTHDLLTKGECPVLGRYDVQAITAIFGDVCDKYILCRSQAEIDERIAIQMTYMVPEKEGGDIPEDPQYGIFGAAYLTSADIKKYGLKSYDFTITDAPGRDYISLKNLERVFGNEVMAKTRENGFKLDEKNLPSTKEIVADLLKATHAFVLIVGNKHSTVSFWEKIYGPERIVLLPSVKLLPEIKATIIGLTEGTLDLSTAENFLAKEAKLTKFQSTEIIRAVAGIPIGAQMMLPNFNKIPLKGDLFKNKGDLWPIKKEEIPNDQKKNKKLWD